MRRLLAIVSAFALLMGLAGISTATTLSTYDWKGNGYPNATCDAGSTTALWIWTGDNPSSLTINGHEQTGSWTQMGKGSWHFTIAINASNFPPTTASITYTGSDGTLTLSGCDEGGTPATPIPTGTVVSTAAPVITPAPTPKETETAETGTPITTPTPTLAPAGAVAGASATPTLAPAGAVAGETGTPTLAPAGAVAGEAGMPGLTPPPTDTAGSVAPAPSNDGVRNFLLGLAGLLVFLVAFARRDRRAEGRNR